MPLPGGANPTSCRPALSANETSSPVSPRDTRVARPASTLPAETEAEAGAEASSALPEGARDAVAARLTVTAVALHKASTA